MMYIYKLINIITNKIYIGKTSVEIEKRIKRHFNEANKGSNLYLHQAIRKYGKENFKVEQIDVAETLEELAEKEKYWIEYYKSYKKEIGYNLTKGGEGGALVGEALERMKASKKGKPHSEKQKAKGYSYLKGINKGNKNINYGKKAYNAGKSLEECFGKEKALQIKKKASINIRKGQKNSIKLKEFRNTQKLQYYNNPNHCTVCNELIEYEPGYKHKRCKKCRYKYKRNKNENS